ncbi:hypothetical protein KY284_035911 [Solanum tuberosum]|nr:hypothetical protein KY284_035911 [Solanum tuberosum]
MLHHLANLSGSYQRNKIILLVKWVHGLYMRNDVSMWEHTPPLDYNLYWKKLNALKNNMRNGYNAMLGELNRLRIADLIWTSVAQPRHRMITWLAVQGSQVMETQLHLFAHCTWLGQMKAEILSWGGMQVYPGEVRQVLEMIKQKN